MGSISAPPKAPNNYHTSTSVIHGGFKEAHDMMEELSLLGTMRLHRTPKTYTLTLCTHMLVKYKFRGTSLCHALKGIKKQLG